LAIFHNAKLELTLRRYLTQKNRPPLALPHHPLFSPPWRTSAPESGPVKSAPFTFARSTIAPLSCRTEITITGHILLIGKNAYIRGKDYAQYCDQ
jgi:hypothetical protein